MQCPNCGKEVPEGSRFCTNCGSVLPNTAPQGSVPQGGRPAAPAWNGAASQGSVPQGGVYTPPPTGGRKKSKAGLIAGIVVGCAVLVVLAVVLLVPGVFSSPKQQAEKAVTKTAAAFAEAGSSRLDLTGGAQLMKAVRDRSYSQSLSLELDSLSPELAGGYDVSALSGLGLDYAGGYDQGSRTMHVTMGARAGDVDLVTFRVLVEDDIMTIGSPEFTKDSAIALNTETLGADLVALGAEDNTGELQNLGFNLFDLMEVMVPDPGEDSDQAGELREAAGQLWEQVQVEKPDKQTIQVNGHSTDTQHYALTIPEAAAKDWLSAVEQALTTSLDTTDRTQALLESMGLSPDLSDEAADVSGSIEEFFDELRQAIQEDVLLDVYTAGGYVMAVKYAWELDGADCEASLYLGGGEHYTDELSLVLSENGEEAVSLTSNGNHEGRDGTFTDTTELRVEDGGSVTRFTSELSYKPEAASDNFSWELTMNGVGSVEISGQISTGEDGLSMDLDDISLLAGGTRLLKLKASYSLEPYQSPDFTLSAPQLLGDMSQEDLQDQYIAVMMNMLEWAERMESELPEDLMYLLFG